MQDGWPSPKLVAYLDPKDPRRAEASRKHYQKNKVIYIDRAKANKLRAQEFVTQTKIGKSCVDCKIPYPPYVLDYDHRDGDEKYDNLCAMAQRGLSNVRLAAEIAKCDLVCANCHRMRSARRGNWQRRSDSN